MAEKANEGNEGMLWNSQKERQMSPTINNKFKLEAIENKTVEIKV